MGKEYYIGLIMCIIGVCLLFLEDVWMSFLGAFIVLIGGIIAGRKYIIKKR